MTSLNDIYERSVKEGACRAAYERDIAAFLQAEIAQTIRRINDVVSKGGCRVRLGDGPHGSYFEVWRGEVQQYIGNTLYEPVVTNPLDAVQIASYDAKAHTFQFGARPFTLTERKTTLTQDDFVRYMVGIIGRLDGGAS